jgi:hypothetical protein
MSKQIDLNPEIKRPMDKANMANDNLALRNLCGFLNNPAVTGAEPPPKGAQLPTIQTEEALDRSGATIAPDPLATMSQPMPAADPGTPAIVDNFNRIFFTGRICVGKDYCAKAVGATIVGFAEPIYYLAKRFLGVGVTADANKDIPGMRAFLQAMGNWGRGTINEKYPVTPARALFVDRIHRLAESGSLPEEYFVEWEKFGEDESLWLNAALARVASQSSSEARLAFTQVRFKNEFTTLQAEGYTHFHVMTSSKSWLERLAKRNLKPDAPALKDTTEQFAAALDQSVIKQISAHKTGPKLHCLWSDSSPPPSTRLWTLAEFCAACSVALPASSDSALDGIMME